MKDLQAQLDAFIANNGLFTRDKHLLVAISGGIDSMVLLHALINNGYKVSAAHCNFNLRGEESDEDEVFVKRICKKLGIVLHNETFKTLDIAKNTGESIQMAARRLRYEWFDALCMVHGYAGVATGHNANDVVETFFVNLSRGTGLSGLTGIKAKNGNIVRPLLFATRVEIEAYAKANNIKWREDSSNKSTKYRRNLIRHKVVPVFEKINPSFLNSMQATIGRLNDSHTLMQALLEEKLEELITENDSKIIVDITKLKLLKPVDLYLYELLNGYGFNGDQVEDIVAALNRTPGQRFYSNEYELIRDRDFLVIQPLVKEKESSKIYFINDDFKTDGLPINLQFKVVLNSPKIKFKQPANIALLDFNKLKFPLKLRHWQQGDRFQPFGMKQSKLLSDYFNDNKFSQTQKEETWILESNGKIVWIVGYRSDNRFAVGPKTTGILHVTLV